MIKIGIEVEKNLETLIRESFRYSFVDTSGYEVQRFSENNILFIIIDDSVKDLEARLRFYKDYKIKVLLLASVFNILTLRKYLRENLIFDFLKKIDYILIEEVVDSLKKQKNKDVNIYIDDSFIKCSIKPKEILYISYSSSIRKSIIKVENDKTYLSKNNLMQIEALLSTHREFQRIERSSIINMKRIKEINLKEELLIFDNGIIFQLSKKILRNLEVKYLNFFNFIKL